MGATRHGEGVVYFAVRHALYGFGLASEERARRVGGANVPASGKELPVLPRLIHILRLLLVRRRRSRRRRRY